MGGLMLCRRVVWVDLQECMCRLQGQVTRVTVGLSTPLAKHDAGPWLQHGGQGPTGPVWAWSCVGVARFGRGRCGAGGNRAKII